MPEFLIRDYFPEDFTALSKIWIECDLGNPARGDNEMVIAKTLSMGGKLFVMEFLHNKKLFGCAWITNDGRRLYLHHFGISSDQRGKGYSKALLKYCLDYAKNTGLQIKLEVHKDNDIAVNLYEKGGFSYLGDYKVYIIRDYAKLPPFFLE